LRNGISNSNHMVMGKFGINFPSSPFGIFEISKFQKRERGKISRN